VQIAGEGLALPDGIGIPVRRHGYEDFSRPDIDTSRIRLKHRPIRLVRSFIPLTFGWQGASAAANLWLERFLGHYDSFRSGNRPSRAKEGTLLNGISPGWCSGL
jgi:hypothetical protein